MVRAGDWRVVRGVFPRGEAVRRWERQAGRDLDLVCQLVEERRTGKGEAPSPTDMPINTLLVYGKPAGTLPQPPGDTGRQGERCLRGHGEENIKMDVRCHDCNIIMALKNIFFLLPLKNKQTTSIHK